MCILVLEVDITKCVKTVSVVENQKAVLEFRVSKPNVQAHWYKQGVEIDFTLPRSVLVADHLKFMLYVYEIMSAVKPRLLILISHRFDYANVAAERHL